MKVIHYFLPLVALIIAASWLTTLRRFTAALEQENDAMRERLTIPGKSSSFQENRKDTALKSVRAGVRPKREKKSSETLIKPLGEFMPTASDFNELVLLNNKEGVKFNLTSACRRLENLASEMSGDELARAYTQMASLPVDAPFRNYLESVMLDQLKKKKIQSLRSANSLQNARMKIRTRSKRAISTNGSREIPPPPIPGMRVRSQLRYSMKPLMEKLPTMCLLKRLL